LLAYSAMAVGAIASLDAPAFYARLAQPVWAPPPWLFGPVWTLLYTLMALALWRVWRRSGPRTAAVWLFMAQLAVNALWSWLFFRWHLGGAAFAWIVLLLVMIVATIRLFVRIDRVAAALLAPYLGWVLFASMLSWSIWRMNPSVL
jgi:tryptophan-rich sensory protein